MKPNKKLTIGRTDKADFPLLHLKQLDVKADTGAYTSSIHCHHIKRVRINGVSHIKFELLDPAHPKYNGKQFKIKDFKVRTIRNSFGMTQTRYSFQTQIHLFEKDWPIELTLSERSKMKFPILLGRKFLTSFFIVDTTKKDLSYNKLLRKKNEKRKS